MFSHYDLIVAQDRADRFASNGYAISGSAGREFKAEDIARRMREIQRHGGGWFRTLFRRLGFVAKTTVTPVTADETPAKATADVIRVSRYSSPSATAARLAQKEAA